MNTIKMWTAEELFKLEDDPNRWIVPGIIPKGSRTLIIGEPGIGKSLFALDLAACVAGESMWLDQFYINIGGPVILASTEGNIFTNKERIKRVFTSHELSVKAPFHFMQDSVLLDNANETNIFKNEIFKIARDYAQNPPLIIFDPLDSFFNGDENSAMHTRPLRRAIDDIVKTFDATVIVLHHVPVEDEKGNKKVRPRGSSSWRGWADTEIYIRREENKGKKYLYANVTKQRDGITGPLLNAPVSLSPAAQKELEAKGGSKLYDEVGFEVLFECDRITFDRNDREGPLDHEKAVLEFLEIQKELKTLRQIYLPVKLTPQQTLVALRKLLDDKKVSTADVLTDNMSDGETKWVGWFRV